MDDLREPTVGEDSILAATLFQPSVIIEFSRPTGRFQAGDRKVVQRARESR
jgi:hypothetical protein